MTRTTGEHIKRIQNYSKQLNTHLKKDEEDDGWK